MARSAPDISRLVMPLVITLAALLLAAGAYFMLIAPKLALLAEGGRYDLTALKADLGEEQAYAARIEAALEEYRTLNSQLRQKVQAIIPLEVDEPGIMATVDAIARTHSMVVKSIDVTPIEDEIGAAGQATARVSVNLEGGDYSEFKLFLADIERSQRLFDVILCRNLAFTYFAPALAQETLVRLVSRLRPGGALVVGVHERLPEGAQAIAPWPECRAVYRVSARAAPASDIPTPSIAAPQSGQRSSRMRLPRTTCP